jgi:cell volume regulation protein A
LLVFPAQFGPIAVKALLLALITALVARPIASMLATMRQGFTRYERVLLAGAGLRGAVPVVLATFAVIAGVPRSIEILNVVFFVVLVSAALQGPAVSWLAARMPSSLAERSVRRQVNDPDSVTREACLET